MKKNLKRIGALVLALCLVLALSVTAFAAEDLSTGIAGEWTAVDTPIILDKSVNLQKELYSDNADDEDVNAPTFGYTYAITAGSAGKTVVDDADNHDPATAVTVTTKAGIMTDLTYTTSIAWTPADTLTEGANTKDIAIDFSNVVFDGYGIYRYVITETPATYGVAGVTEGDTSHVRYLDVYVKASDTYTDGSLASDWDIYGYVCMAENDDVTTATDKTNGFVSGTGLDPDTYYTFNVKVSKTVAGDTYVMSTHAEFPFAVAFENATVTNDVLPIVNASANYATVTAPTAADNINNITSAPTIGHEGYVEYIGIPSGTEVSVHETNNQAGTTYAVTTTGADTNLDEAVANPDDSSDAVYDAQTALEANDSTEIAFTNTLSLISPTGVVFRVAPFMMILAAGIVLLLLSIRRRRLADDEA